MSMKIKGIWSLFLLIPSLISLVWYLKLCGQLVKVIASVSSPTPKFGCLFIKDLNDKWSINFIGIWGWISILVTILILIYFVIVNIKSEKKNN